jgi:uncharacterized protein YciI
VKTLKPTREPFRRAVLGGLVIVLAFLASPANADEPAPATTPRSQYAMTTYYVGFLSRGPKWTPEVTEETKKLQEAHLANISRLASTGKLVLAGPFMDGGSLRGMFVFQVGSMEEAKALCDTDPAVQAGRLAVELHPWYSAKGIRTDPPKAP